MISCKVESTTSPDGSLQVEDVQTALALAGHHRPAVGRGGAGAHGALAGEDGQRATAGQVPDAHGVVGGGREKATVRHSGEVPDSPAMAAQDSGELATMEIEDPKAAVFAADDALAAVRGEGHGTYSAHPGREGAEAAAAGEIPQDQLSIPRRGESLLAVCNDRQEVEKLIGKIEVK